MSPDVARSLKILWLKIQLVDSTQVDEANIPCFQIHKGLSPSSDSPKPMSGDAGLFIWLSLTV